MLAEGTIGHLTDAAVDYYDLAGDPKRWEIGVKEVWEIEKPLDRVIHTMNWPLRPGPKYNEFGGSFIYPMGEDKLCIGMVAGLDTTDATFSCHDLLQQLKTHPFIRDLLKGGKRVGWGAKTIPSGGYWSMPRKLAVPGMVMCGDNVSMCNIPYLKGIHYAMHAGIYAAEAIVEELKRDPESVNFQGYEDRVRKSDIEKDLFKSRNVRQHGDKGFIAFGAIANAWLLSNGLVPAATRSPRRTRRSRPSSAMPPTPIPSPTASTSSTSSHPSSSRATRPATTRLITCASSATFRAK